MEIVKIDLTSSPPALVLDFASHEKLYTLYGVCLVLAYTSKNSFKGRSHDAYICNYLYINALPCELLNMI